MRPKFASSQAFIVPAHFFAIFSDFTAERIVPPPPPFHNSSLVPKNHFIFSKNPQYVQTVLQGVKL
jgi:hypothetical protein